jgi:hypothetical protein
MTFDVNAFGSGVGLVLLGYLCGFVVGSIVGAFRADR